jgi:hypothetical protein
VSPIARVDSGYIGCCYDEGEFQFFAKLIEAHGIPVERRGRYSTMGITISLYTDPKNVRRAREIRRGFKAAMLIRHDVMDFLLGVRAALTIRKRGDHANRQIGQVAGRDDCAYRLLGAPKEKHRA